MLLTAAIGLHNKWTKFNDSRRRINRDVSIGRATPQERRDDGPRIPSVRSPDLNDRLRQEQDWPVPGDAAGPG
jgi:hypothetical protein